MLIPINERFRCVVRCTGAVLDAVVLPSSSAAEALVSGGLSLPSGLRVFAIGPATAATRVESGIPRWGESPYL
mgnify:CR=1 FL=1